MPIYDYQCKKCKEVFEVVTLGDVKRNDVEPCPKCNGEGVYVISGAPLAIFKGSGWTSKGAGD